MKNLKIALVALLGILAAGCYNDFDTPGPMKLWNDEDMAAMGLTQITIKQLKDRYNTEFGSVAGTGTNDDWATTKTLKLGKPYPGEEEFSNLAFWEEAENMYIKGKVISSDAQGNVYKTLYIDDGTAGIELKLFGTLYVYYRLDLGNLDSQWVYVRLSDLYLGNYRMMLSLGKQPSNSLNTALRDKYYGNSNFPSMAFMNTNVFAGERVKLTDENITTVNSSNYQMLAGQEGEKYFGRLVKFEGIKIRYAGVTYQDEVGRNPDGSIEWGPEITAPPVKSGSNENPFPSWIVTDWGTPQFSPWYRWAYSRQNSKGRLVSLYASVLMSYDDNATDLADAGLYLIRTSGYSRFAMQPIPKNGTEGNVLGIFGVYAKSWTQYPQYQITVSRIEDLDFPKESLLSDEWIEHNTPETSYHPPVKDNFGDADYE